MNEQHKISLADLPVLGSSFLGGFYTGKLLVGEQLYGIVTAPKALGEFKAKPWGKYGEDVSGATSFYDGFLNTAAMAEAKCPLALDALALSVAMQADWYIPSRDELEMQYRLFKPTTSDNYVYRDGDNPSSVPAGYPYKKQVPAQTSIALYLPGASEAFEGAWYWSSTQYSPHDAWLQNFSDGGQSLYGKDDEFSARAVRRFIIQ